MLRNSVRATSLLVRLSRSVYSAAALPTSELTLSDLELVKNVRLPKVRSNALRDTTAAVASRLSQQTQFPLLPGTPFSLEGALNTNPFRHARVITTQGPAAAALFCNEEWAMITGYTLQELKGKTAVEAIVAEWTDPLTVRKIEEAICFGNRLRTMIMTSKKDGTPVMVHLQITPLLNKNGESTHNLAVLHSVV